MTPDEAAHAAALEAAAAVMFLPSTPGIRNRPMVCLRCFALVPSEPAEARPAHLEWHAEAGR